METLEFVRNGNKVGIVYLNRPPYNPLSSKVYKELLELFKSLENDEEIRAIILTGKGDRAFAAGADIKEMMNLNGVEMMEMSRISREATNKVESIGKPVIAAVDGLALGGGCELALACDFRICSRTTKFGLPEINLGIIPGGGGTQRLPRLIGQGKAKELLYFGEMIEADHALKIGLVNKVVKSEEVLDESVRWAEKLAQKPYVAMKMLKTAVQKGTEVDLQTGLDLETACFGNAFASEDRVEGMQSFVEKRQPQFVGR